MYDIITLRCGSAEHDVTLSTLDKRIIDLLQATISGSSLAIVRSVFTSSHRSRAKSIARVELMRTLEELLEAIGRERERWSYVYSTEVKSGPLASSGTGGMSGIRMPGDTAHFYSLSAGVGKCDLTKWAIDNNGQGIVAETIDCRDETSLLTGNTGEIKIKRRKIELTLPVELQRLQSKLIEFPCDELLLSYSESARHP